MIKLKRAYEPTAREDGQRVLVERLWPRGVKKTQLHLDAWRKDVAPSAELRRWFGHDSEKWREFQRRYFMELNDNPQAWEPLLEQARRATVTLVFAARDPEHNNAVALKQFLEAKLARRKQAA